MAEIRSASEIAEKWQRVTPGRSQDYQRGVANPRRDWETETSASEDRWAEGVQSAISEGTFGRGVTAAGTGKWSRKTQEVGVGRWGPGVRAAAEDYQRGYEPYRQTIESVDLPPRFPSGDPRNFERVRAIGEALHERRLRGA